MMRREIIYLRYADLEQRGLVANRTTLRRWILAGRFPPPVHLGENTIAWPSDEVEEWERERRAERAPAEAS
ncbi:AlpA family phage regulatory protein [Acidobacteria bacterium AH-259-O06]|nr:AlpA family phage regulatory protein [Acidobacteria bacterium AH-259-G07]MDA2928728.1 AlpA family phage regulatory protein [Acidobacteria bacterium AH-259-O06]